MEVGILARHAVGEALERDLWGAAGPYFAVFARPPPAVFFYALTPRFPCNPVSPSPCFQRFRTSVVLLTENYSLLSVSVRPQRKMKWVV